MEFMKKHLPFLTHLSQHGEEGLTSYTDVQTLSLGAPKHVPTVPHG